MLATATTNTRYEDKVLGQGNAGDYNYHDAVTYPFRLRPALHHL